MVKNVQAIGTTLRISRPKITAGLENAKPIQFFSSYGKVPRNAAMTGNKYTAKAAKTSAIVYSPYRNAAIGPVNCLHQKISRYTSTDKISRISHDMVAWRKFSFSPIQKVLTGLMSPFSRRLSSMVY